MGYRNLNHYQSVVLTIFYKYYKICTITGSVFVTRQCFSCVTEFYKHFYFICLSYWSTGKTENAINFIDVGSMLLVSSLYEQHSDNV